MFLLSWKTAICIALFAFGASPAFSEPLFVRVRVDTDQFRRNFELNQRTLVDRQERYMKERGSLKDRDDSVFGPKELEQSPIDICSLNLDLKRCGIFR